MTCARRPRLRHSPGIVLLLAGMMSGAIVASRPNVAHADAWFGPDKPLHAGVSAGLAVSGYGVSALWLPSRPGRAAVGAGFALALGAGKELYDFGTGGDPSWRDWTWDVIGTASGVGIAWLIDALIFGSSHVPSEPAVDGAARGQVLQSGMAMAPPGTLGYFSSSCHD
jgi:putative lipoprotein